MIGVAERRWIWMIGEAAWEGIVMTSTRSSTARMARTFSCRVLRIDGVFRRMLIPSEAETAKRAGTAAEKTNEVPLMRWWSTTICEPAQNPPDEFRPLATEPTIISICVACTTCGEAS
jgi:hypothetical protein